jgi:blue copper oxidase
MKRNQFLKLTGVGSAFTLIGGISWLMQSCNRQNKVSAMAQSLKVNNGSFDTLLPSPPLFDLKNIAPFETKELQIEILKGKKTGVYGYYDGILGRTFEVKTGDSINLQFINTLPEATNIHWHGLLIPPQMDGFPSHVTPPNGTFKYQFTINQRAGTYWYHPHPDGSTAKQVMKGLAGVFIVRDEEEAALKLPDKDNETIVVIQDRRFKNDGNFDYDPTSEEMMTGFLGDHILVNGALNPYKIVNAGWNRIRIVNGSNARVYNLAFSNGQEFFVIGSDAGLMSVPETTKNILLAPGERLDLLINFTQQANKEIFLKSETFSNGGIQGKDAFDILKFKVSARISEAFNLPKKLSTIPRINPTSITKTRKFDISNASMHAESKMAMPHTDNGKLKMGMHTINGIAYDATKIHETVNAGATEIWEFDNSKGDEIHPMHFHGNHFQILERTGGRGKLLATENGWKDTVLLLPGETVKIITTFSQFKGKYVLHCHNLEHEDSGMMLNFEIT